MSLDYQPPQKRRKVAVPEMLVQTGECLRRMKKSRKAAEDAEVIVLASFHRL